MPITRSEVLRRAQSIWPMQGVPYSQDAIHRPDGYRADCSGYVSACWAIPLNAPGSWGGMNTVSLVTSGWMREIAIDDLKPGDAVGRCGPGTGGDDGHIQLFVAWLNTDPGDSRYYCLEQSGGRSGPHRELYNWRPGYRAYRYRDIVDDTQGGDDMSQAAEEAIGQILAKLTWIDPRVEALTHGYDTVRFGPEKGAPVEAAQRITALEAKVGSVQAGGQPTQEQVDAAMLAAMRDPAVLAGIGAAIASHLHVT